jgi:hypothetical protein
MCVCVCVCVNVFVNVCVCVNLCMYRVFHRWLIDFKLKSIFATALKNKSASKGVIIDSKQSAR